MEGKIHKYNIKNVPYGELKYVLKGTLYHLCLFKFLDIQSISELDLEDPAIVKLCRNHNESHNAIVTNDEGYKFVLSKNNREDNVYID